MQMTNEKWDARYIEKVRKDSTYVNVMNIPIVPDVFTFVATQHLFNTFPISWEFLMLWNASLSHCPLLLGHRHVTSSAHQMSLSQTGAQRVLNQEGREGNSLCLEGGGQQGCWKGSRYDIVFGAQKWQWCRLGHVGPSSVVQFDIASGSWAQLGPPAPLPMKLFNMFAINSFSLNWIKIKTPKWRTLIYGVWRKH